MDILAIILRTVRQHIEATGVPPDQLQDALADAEHALRGSLGGAVHHISRLPQVATKARVHELAAQGLTPQQIAERLGITDRHARRLMQLLRV